MKTQVTFFNQAMPVSLSKTLFFILLIVITSCSSDDSVTPDPDPDPVLQADIPTVDNSVLTFLQNHNAPGASLAVSVNGKMVYQKGYGLANTNTSEGVETSDVFRIASISKVFTSVAILKLIEEGRLSLSDQVFGPTGILGNDFGAANLTSQEMQVTVDQLLLHQSGGWWTTNGNYDVIDYAPELSNQDFYEYIFTYAGLSNSPGSTFRYNNTGYWMLARIIEKVSGMSYENYLQSMVAPLGVTSLKVTTFQTSDREPNEVQYYGNSTDTQYIYTIADRRDGDAGVVISAPDLLRFLNAIDGDPTRPDILGATGIQLLSQTTNLSSLGRGVGVWEAQEVYFFTGSLPGNRSWFIMGQNGRIATLLVNYRGTGSYDNDLQSTLLNIVKNNGIQWQTDIDQF